jgi:hypothetical protein
MISRLPAERQSSMLLKMVSSKLSKFTLHIPLGERGAGFKVSDHSTQAHGRN